MGGREASSPAGPVAQSTEVGFYSRSNGKALKALRINLLMLNENRLQVYSLSSFAFTSFFLTSPSTSAGEKGLK